MSSDFEKIPLLITFPLLMKQKKITSQEDKAYFEKEYCPFQHT